MFNYIDIFEKLSTALLSAEVLFVPFLLVPLMCFVVKRFHMYFTSNLYFLRSLFIVSFPKCILFLYGSFAVACHSKRSFSVSEASVQNRLSSIHSLDTA